MLVNPKNNWYTDTMRVCRDQDVPNGAVTNTARVEIMLGIPCRVYQNSKPNVKMSDNAADYAPSDKLACSNDVDIREGDEIWVTRGGRLGYANSEQRYYAGKAAKYYEPFGGVKMGLAHQEIPLSGEERVKRR
ncbi:MAG: hypothetical protein LBN43_00060 [Oscillospiraceae bacterium]|jgi:hypothetical protein|nr:hypothetical protein [Oscillospiraceae bacterium]